MQKPGKKALEIITYIFGLGMPYRENVCLYNLFYYLFVHFTGENIL